MVTTVYGATKKLIDAFQKDAGKGQTVVLIAFPHSRMKAVGLVTRHFTDDDTGEILAAVYVPTAPNPTGGYLEIVPVDELVPLDWSVDEAMSFVFSGGTTAPDRIRFSHRGREAGGEATGQSAAEGDADPRTGAAVAVSPTSVQAGA
jgi:uncharacterized membrane protein